jgi:hypothetical protein
MLRRVKPKEQAYSTKTLKGAVTHLKQANYL